MVHIFVAVHIGFSYVAAVFVDLVVVVVDNVVAMALLVVNDHIVLSCGQ